MQKKYNTKTSQSIQTFLATQNEKCFCVADVCAYLEEQGIQMNVTTVYRNLDRLIAQDKIVKYKAPNSENFLYRMVKENGNCHSHLHLQCRLCGKIVHLDHVCMDFMREQLQHQYGFTLECENSSLCGICDECSAHMSEQE